MIPIIKWTLWQRRWSTFWWCAGMVLLIFVTMIFYPTFRDQAAQLQKTFEGLSNTTLQFIGGTADFFSPVGYLNSQIFFLTLPMILAVLSIGLGNSLLGREEQEQTLETLLARPISRTKLLAAKAATGTILLAFVTSIALLTTLITAKLVDLKVPVSDMVFAGFACFLLVLSFGAVSFLLAGTGRARSASIGIATFVAFGGYIISSLAGTVDWLRWPAKFFPFHYYQSEAILRGSFRWADAAALVGVVVACGLLAWASFRRRDLG